MADRMPMLVRALFTARVVVLLLRYAQACACLRLCMPALMHGYLCVLRLSTANAQYPIAIPYFSVLCTVRYCFIRDCVLFQHTCNYTWSSAPATHLDSEPSRTVLPPSAVDAPLPTVCATMVSMATGGQCRATLWPVGG